MLTILSDCDESDEGAVVVDDVHDSEVDRNGGEFQSLMKEYKRQQESMAFISKHLTEVKTQLATLNNERDSCQTILREIREKLAARQSKNVKSPPPNNDTIAQFTDTKFAWSDRLARIRDNTFKLTSFRPFQLVAINATLSKKDVFLILPTGGGKSLTYQLAAMVEPGLTLVVSPLLSLMEDQVFQLKRLGIDARLMTSGTAAAENSQTLRDLTNGVKLLYVTPERLAKSKRLMNRLEACHTQKLLSRFAIDELHCASQWGHDFRKDYASLLLLRRQFADVPILGLTATASPEVVDDVTRLLGLKASSILVLRSSFNRPNLVYEVAAKPSSAQETLDRMVTSIRRRFPAKSGIVYCLSRRDCEDVADGFNARGIPAAAYHADLDMTNRIDIQKRWTRFKSDADRQSEDTVIVATIAFGMGIDKPDVGFVFHHSVSKSLEAYYQESGRAGRDASLTAHCILWFRLADAHRIAAMVVGQRNGEAHLKQILAYAVTENQCRRVSMAKGAFASETIDPEVHCKKHCDFCIAKAAAKPGIEFTLDTSKEVLEIGRILQDFAASNAQAKGMTILQLKNQFDKKKSKSSTLTPHNFDRILAKLYCDGLLNLNYHFTPYNTIVYVQNSSRFIRVITSSSTTFHFSLPVIPPLSSSTSSSTGKRPAKSISYSGISKKSKTSELPSADDAKSSRLDSDSIDESKSDPDGVQVKVEDDLCSQLQF